MTVSATFMDEIDWDGRLQGRMSEENRITFYFHPVASLPFDVTATYGNANSITQPIVGCKFVELIPAELTCNFATKISAKSKGLGRPDDSVHHAGQMYISSSNKHI